MGYTQHRLYKDHNKDSDSRQMEDLLQERGPTVLLTASGKRMTVNGSVKLKVEANGIHVSIDALVSNAIRD